MESRCSKNQFAHAHATVTELSCPSFAGISSVMAWYRLAEMSLVIPSIWPDEHPLWNLVGIEILVEHSMVLNLSQSVKFVSHNSSRDYQIPVSSSLAV